MLSRRAGEVSGAGKDFNSKDSAFGKMSRKTGELKAGWRILISCVHACPHRDHFSSDKSYEIQTEEVGARGRAVSTLESGDCADVENQFGCAQRGPRKGPSRSREIDASRRIPSAKLRIRAY